MALDLIPMGKPVAGYEKRFEQIFNHLTGKEKIELSLLDKQEGRTIPSNDELLKEWRANQIPSYITINAPKVGKDKIADEWIKAQYRETEMKIAEEDFIDGYQNYYVVELAEHIDGVPVYVSMNHDANVFRAQFLLDCEDIIGTDLVNEIWESKFAKDALDYGNRLINIADSLAQSHNLQHIREQRMPPDSSENSLESKLHIVYSLSKWLIFYGKNGHGYEADY